MKSATSVLKSVFNYREFKIGRVSGIPLMIDYRWPLIALLHVWLLAKVFLPYELRHLQPLPLVPTLLCATVMTALLFVSIVIHELAHAGAAKLEGIKTIEIRLHPLGGWAKLETIPKTPLAEFRIVIMGPVSSFLLALIFLSGMRIVSAVVPGRGFLFEIFSYLFLANLLLAMFNLLPGLPLDGGRALRAWLWHRKGDILAATQTTARLGVALSYMLISFGLWRLVRYGDLLSAVGLAIIGWFLKTSAENDVRYRQQQRAYEDAAKEAVENSLSQWNVEGTVGSVLNAPVVTVAPDLHISEFVDEVLSRHRRTSFPVACEGRLHGILSLERLREVPPENWERVFIREVMQPVDDSLFVTVRASLEHAANKIKMNQLQHVAVVDGDGYLVGYLSAEDLSR